MVTVFDVINAANSAGCNSLNMQSLGNFLTLNEDWFSEGDFERMVGVILIIKEDIIDPKCSELWPEKEAEFDYGNVVQNLNDNERRFLWNSFNYDELTYMLECHCAMSHEFRFWFNMDTDNDGYPLFYSGMREEEGHKQTVSYITTYGTTPAYTEFTGTITEANLPTLTADGYIHKGWAVSYPHAGWVDQPVAVGDEFVYGPLLKAVWEEIPTTINYTISYDDMYGNAPGSKVVTVPYGEKYSLTADDLPVIYNDIYDFVGWST